MYFSFLVCIVIFKLKYSLHKTIVPDYMNYNSIVHFARTYQKVRVHAFTLLRLVLQASITIY